MKIKTILSAFLVCSLVFTMTACSGKDTEKKATTDPVESSTEKPFDASACAEAYLDAYFKGNGADYAEISGTSEAAATDFYEKHMEELLNTSLGIVEEVPGSSSAVSPKLRQDYADMWDKIFQNTRYTVTDSEKTDDAYTITVETQKMLLYSKLEEIMPEKLETLYADAVSEESEEGSSDPYTLMMLEAYQDALEQVTYAEAKEITIKLAPDETATWIISSEDLQTLQNNLIDYDAANNGFLDGNPVELQTEASPNQSYPDDLNQTPVYQIGETIHLQRDGRDIADFCINSVEITEERNEYESYVPDKVIVINYTYQNLDSEEPLLYDEMSFKILDGDTVCPSYYTDSLISADIAMKGESAVQSSLAYGISNSCQEIIIYVNNSQLDCPIQVKASLS